MKYIPPEELSVAYQEARRLGLIEPVDTTIIFVDLAIIDDRLSRLKAAFPKNTLHAIPVKTNPLTFILKYIAANGLGLEAASLGEVVLASHAGVDSDNIVFDSPAKTLEEILFLEKHHKTIRINADSLEELDRYPKDTSCFSLGIRINPLVEAVSVDSMNVGTEDSKFGVPITSHAEIVAACLSRKEVDCLHLHIGSQVSSYQPTVMAVRRVVDLAKDINCTAGEQRISFIDIGGGFPVNYSDDEPCLIEDYAEALRQECGELFDGTFNPITEFGRYIYGNAGWAITQVEYIKENTAGFTLICHAGADLFVRECYNPGDWPHRISVLDEAGRLRSNSKVTTSVAGPLCFGGDYIARNQMLQKASPGDFLAIRDIGANTFALFSRHCSRPFPKVIAYRGAGSPSDFYIAKKRESLASIVDFWS